MGVVQTWHSSVSNMALFVYTIADIYLLDDPFSAVDAHTATHLFHEYVMGALSGKTVLLVTHQVDFLPVFDSVLLMSNGKILDGAPYQILLASSQKFLALVNVHRDAPAPDRLVEIVSSHRRVSSPKETAKSGDEKQLKESKGHQLIKQEEIESPDTVWKPYIQYLNQNRGFVYFSIVISCQITFFTLQIMQNYWMVANVQNPQVSKLRLIVVYMLLGCSSTLFILVRSLSTVALGIKCSIYFFDQLLNSLFRPPIAFYESTPLGRILSRVSSDLSILDLDLPFCFVGAFLASISTWVNLGVVSVITWQVLVVSVPLVYLVIHLQVSYSSELSNREPTFDMDLSDFMDGEQPISYDATNRFFAKDPSQKWAAYVAELFLF